MAAEVVLIGAGRIEARRRWVGLLAVLLGQLMLIIDGTVVNVAFPVIQADLQLSEACLTWIASAYLIAFGGLLLLFGRLGDLLGRRRVFLFGIGLFTAASAACGLAGTASLLIAARFVQGIGAAGASSAVLAIIAIEFPDPGNRAKAMSGYTFISVTGGSLGLLIGGALIQVLDWHWIFIINVPVGLLTIHLGRTVLRETQADGLGRGLDVGGAVLITASAMMAICALVATARHAWNAPAVVLPGIAAVAALAVFLAVEARHVNPLMPLRILRIRSLIASSIVRGFLAMGMYAVSLFGVLDLSLALGFGPMRVGLSFLPQPMIVAALSLGGTARLMGRFGAQRVLFAGLSLLAVALWTFARRDADAPYWPGRFLSYAIVGVGAGMSFLPLLTIAMSDVPPRDAGLGSSIVNLSLQLAAAIDLSILSAVASYRTDALTARHVDPRDALIGGYRAGYAVAVAGVVVGLVLAIALLRGRDSARGAALAKDRAPAHDRGG